MDNKIAQIKMIVMDVDGVLTSGEIIYSNKGDELKIFNVQDGFGLTLAKRSGLKTGLITGRKSKLVDKRAKELKFNFVSQGNIKKLKPYLELLEKYDLKDEQVCYIGDDIPDLAILSRAGFRVAVANARDEVKNICDYVTTAKGGQGAVRETIDLILSKQAKLSKIIEDFIK